MAHSTTIPQRKCVVCRKMRPRNEQLRLSAPKRDGQILPNPLGNLGGKGYYVCAQISCVSKLRTEKKMRKVFSTRISDETYEWLLEHLQLGDDLDSPDYEINSIDHTNKTNSAT